MKNYNPNSLDPYVPDEVETNHLLCSLCRYEYHENPRVYMKALLVLFTTLNFSEDWFFNTFYPKFVKKYPKLLDI